MSFQVKDILERHRGKYLYNLTIDSCEQVPVGAKSRLLTVANGELTHYLKIVYQDNHIAEFIRKSHYCKQT